jgi:hypothetical protein
MCRRRLPIAGRSAAKALRTSQETLDFGFFQVIGVIGT